MPESKSDTKNRDKDLYFMRMASVASTLATCPRKSVGAVIVRNKRIVATGYNGSIGGQPHCEDAGCMMEDGHCIRTIHSEANAILQAARTGMNIEGCAIYVTASPCFNCFKLIAGAGLKRIVFGELYRDERISSMYPIPLKPRARPPVMASALDPNLGDEGEFLVSDVRNSFFPMPADRAIREYCEKIWQVNPVEIG